MLSDGWECVDDPTLVLQAHRTVLVIGTHALNVARRGRDGLWRYEICRLDKQQARRDARVPFCPAAHATRLLTSW